MFRNQQMRFGIYCFFVPVFALELMPLSKRWLEDWNTSAPFPDDQFAVHTGTSVAFGMEGESPFTPDELAFAKKRRQDSLDSLEGQMRLLRKKSLAAAKAKEPEAFRQSKQEIQALDDSIRDLKKKSIADFAAQIREEKEREVRLKAAEVERQKAEKALEAVREQARLEILRRPKLQPETMRLGDKGFLQNFDGGEYRLRVVFGTEGGVLAQIGAKDSFLVITGVESSSLVTDRWFSLSQQMEVVGTRDFLKDGESQVSYFVLKPADKSETAIVPLSPPPPPGQRIPPPSDQRVRVPRNF